MVNFGLFFFLGWTRSTVWSLPLKQQDQIQDPGSRIQIQGPDPGTRSRVQGPDPGSRVQIQLRLCPGLSGGSILVNVNPNLLMEGGGRRRANPPPSSVFQALIHMDAGGSECPPSAAVLRRVGPTQTLAGGEVSVGALAGVDVFPPGPS